jgi:hypothetical protein
MSFEIMWIYGDEVAKYLFPFVLFCTARDKAEKYSGWREQSGSQRIINGFQALTLVVCPEQLLNSASYWRLQTDFIPNTSLCQGLYVEDLYFKIKVGII